MLREGTAFAQKIIDFYADKGIACSVVDEHLSLLVTLSSDDRIHEFRYGGRAFAGMRGWKKFYLTLDRESSKLLASPAPLPPAYKLRSKLKCRLLEDIGGL